MELQRIEFEVRPVPPYRLDFTAWILRRNPRNEIDVFEDNTYHRAIALREKVVEVIAKQGGSEDKPIVKIIARGKELQKSDKPEIRSILGNLLGFDVDISGFYDLAKHYPKLNTLAKRFRGAKPVKFPTLFETLVNAIACQQVSLSAGLIFLNRLSKKYGYRDVGSFYTFAEPRKLIRARIPTLRSLGFSRQKAVSILCAARSCLRGGIDPQELGGMNDDRAIEYLSSLRGIGRWSAEYAMLRGLGRINVFPADDIGARNNLVRWLSIRRELDYQGVKEILRPWYPYSGLVYFHLLLDHISDSGYLS